MAGVPVDHGWAWVVACGVFINFFWTLANTRIMGIFFIEMSTFYDASSTSTSFMFFFFLGAFTVTGAVYGGLADRFSDRQMSIVGCLLQTLGAVIQVFAPNIYVFTITYGCLSGTGFGLCYISSSIIMGRYFKDQLGLVSGLTFAGSSVGQLIIPQLVNYLLQVYDIRGVFLIFGGCLLNILPGALLFRPASFYNKATTNKEQTSANKATDNALKLDEKRESIAMQNDKTIDDEEGKNNSTTLVTSRRLSNAHVELVIQPDDNNITFSGLHFFADVTPFVHSKVFTFWANQPGMELFHPVANTPITFFSASRLLCSLQVQVLMIGRIVMSGMFFVFVFFAPPFTYSRGFTLSQTSVMLTIVGALDLCSKPVHGWIASMKNVDVTLYNTTVTLIGCVVCMISSLIHSSVSTYLFNISGGLWLSQTVTLSVQIWKENVGGKLFPVAFNMNTMLVGIYTIAMCVLIGWLGDMFHSYDIALMSVFGAGSLAAFMCLGQWLYLRWNKTSIVDQLEENLSQVN